LLCGDMLDHADPDIVWKSVRPIFARSLVDGLTLSSIVMQAGVGLHMWDVTMAQYNPGLGIVSASHTCLSTYVCILNQSSGPS
jgi:hypothetical protein